MANSKNMTEKLIAEFTENYLENLFYFCLKKTGNNAEAEDLTQDITLNILTALNWEPFPHIFRHGSGVSHATVTQNGQI